MRTRSGHLFKRDNGIYCFQWRVDGKLFQRSTTSRNLKDAKRIRDELLKPYRDRGMEKVDLFKQIIVRLLNKTRKRRNVPARIPIHRILLPMLTAAKQNASNNYVLPELSSAYESDPVALIRKIQDQFHKNGISTQEKKQGQRKRNPVEESFYSLRHALVGFCRESGAPMSVPVVTTDIHAMRARKSRHRVFSVVLCVLTCLALPRSVSGQDGGRTAPGAPFEPTASSARAETSKPMGFFQRHLQSGKTTPDASEAQAPARNGSAVQPRLLPGVWVNLSVVVGGSTELQPHKYQVSNRGILTLPLVGEQLVNGKTIEEAAGALQKSYQEYYIEPNVFLGFPLDTSSQGVSPWGTVIVMGRVKDPGSISIPPSGRLTVSQAIVMAGGLDTSAKHRSVRVTTRDASGKSVILKVNLHDINVDGKSEEDVVLKPGDAVYVPESLL